MIPAHRRIIRIGKPLSRREQGPLIYSGFSKKHEDAARAPETVEYLFAFWYWVPPHQRCTWAGKSHVPCATTQELAMLATGELEEVRRNFAYPATMSMPDLQRELLRLFWEPECIRRLGEIPEVFRGKSPLSDALGARQLEHARRSIILPGG